LIVSPAVSKKLQEKQRRRLEQERRQQEQRRAARRRNLVTVGIGVLVALLVVVLVIRDRQQETEATEELTGISAEEAGCGDVEEPDTEGRTHVPEGTDVEYATTPPTSGDHYATPANTGFYPAPLPEEQLVHNLEHGQIVIWYRTDAPSEVIDALEAVFEQERVATIATQYDRVPAGFNFVMTAWGASQACELVSQEVVNDFRREYQGQGPEKIAPPFEG
jgi:hypothetical protein